MTAQEKDRGEHRGLADWIAFSPDEARIERQWAAIRARKGGPGRIARTPWRAAAALGLGVALAAGLLALPRSSPTPEAPALALEGARLRAEAGAASLVLPDGVEIALAPGAEARLAEIGASRAVIALDAGEITLDIPAGRGRSWAVRAGSTEVRVVGTRFSVARGPGEDAAGGVLVRVERGRVEVVRPGEPPRALEAGETWSVGWPGTAEGSGPDGAAGGSPEAGAAPSEALPEAPSEEAAEATPEPGARPAAPAWEILARARRYREAYEALGEAGFRREVERGGAERLLRLAELARAAGRLRDAERAFDALRRRHRGDARAGLAAFELGRLRMDALGSPSGAAEALADAIALAPGAPFREDAEARRVQALEASGSAAACVKARDAYLARFPSGVHAASVRARCRPR